MANDTAGINLGTIVCKHCEELIDTFDAEKVTLYYSDCQEQQCLQERTRKPAGQPC